MWSVIVQEIYFAIYYPDFFRRAKSTFVTGLFMIPLHGLLDGPQTIHQVLNETERLPLPARSGQPRLVNDPEEGQEIGPPNFTFQLRKDKLRQVRRRQERIGAPLSGLRGFVGWGSRLFRPGCHIAGFQSDAPRRVMGS